MTTLFTVSADDISTMLAYVGQLITDAMPLLIILLAVLIGIIIINAIINLF
jgi:hypothetical protein